MTELVQPTLHTKSQSVRNCLIDMGSKASFKLKEIEKHAFPTIHVPSAWGFGLSPKTLRVWENDDDLWLIVHPLELLRGEF